MSRYSIPIFNDKDWSNSSTSFSNSTSSLLSNALYDAFGRQRVSDVGNRYDVEFTLDKQPLLTREVISGNATITYNSSSRDLSLAVVETNTNTSAILCSVYNTPYTPGCSQLIDLTGTLDETGIGGGTASIFLRNNGSETTYDQSSWIYSDNADTVDWKYSQIFSIDFQSLKVGRIRFFLVRGGAPYLVHYIENDNKRTGGYWQHPNLRPYWKIYNTADTTISELGYGSYDNGCGFRYTFASKDSSAKMRAICATVKSEGGQNIFDLQGFPFSATNYLTSVTIGNSLIPLLSIQVRPTFNSLNNRTVVIPQALTIQNDNPILYRLVLNPTLTGASFVAVDSNSSVYKDTSATAYSGGTIIDEDYLSTGTTKTASTEKRLLGKTILSSNWLATTGDILTIVAVRTTNTSAVTLGRISWIEVR